MMDTALQNSSCSPGIAIVTSPGQHTHTQPDNWSTMEIQHLPLSFLVGYIKRPDVLRLVSSNDTDVHITPRTLAKKKNLSKISKKCISCFFKISVILLYGTNQVIENAGSNGISNQLNSLLLLRINTTVKERELPNWPNRFSLTHLHVGSETVFKGCHGSEGARAHGDIGKFVSGAVSMDSVEIGSSDVHPSQHQVGSYVAVVVE